MLLPLQTPWQMLVSSVAMMLLSSCTEVAVPQSTDSNQAFIKVGGSAEALELIENLAAAYEASGADVQINFLPPSRSDGGIQGVKDEVLDIGAISAEPEVADIDNLQYVSLANVPLAMIVHETVTGVEDLTTQQLQHIYQGNITNWQEVGGPDTEIILLDYVEDEDEKVMLRKHYLGPELQISDHAVIFPEDNELLEAVVITPNSIAAAPLKRAPDDVPIRILSLDGIAPTPTNLQTGAYPMAIQLGLVAAESPSPDVTNFIQFILSPNGQAILNSETKLDIGESK